VSERPDSNQPDPPGGQTNEAGGRPVRRRRRVVRPGVGEPDPPIDRRSADDTDLGWESTPGRDGSDSNDERLRRDVPPHW
jgi:hypothetical protein